MSLTINIDAFSGIWDRAVLVLADSALKGVLLLALAGGVAWLLRRRSAAARHLNWLMALTGLLLLPVVSLLVPQWRLPVLPAASAETRPDSAPLLATAPRFAMPQVALPVAEPQVPLEIPAAATPQPSVVQESPSVQAAGRIQAPAPKRPIPVTLYLLAIWLGVGLLVLVKLPIGLAMIARLRRKAVSLNHEPWSTLATGLARSLHLARPVRLLMSADSAMPMAVGLLRPAVLLPREVQNWTPEKRRVVLLHELAHVRRLDCLTHALARVALALHWFNPLAWLAMRRLTAERELACDDMVLAAGSLPSSYAGHLLDIARTMHSGSLTAAAAVTMARCSQLEGRLLAILDTARPRQAATRWMLAWGLFILAALILPLAAIRLGQAQAAADDVYKPIVPESKPTSDITGIVKDESGKPVAGVEVLAVGGWEPGSERQTAKTDADGRCIFQDLKPKGWSFSVNDPRYGWEWEHERWQTVPAKPEDLPVAITLYHPRTLVGTVVDEGGKPVAGVRVVLVNQMLPGRAEPVSGHIDVDFLVAQTDNTGRFTMERLRPGRADFMLEHPDYANTFAAINLEGKEATLTIQKGLTLRGRVTHNGQPVGGVAVRAGRTEAHRPIVDWQGKTDAEGRFEVPRIPSAPAEDRGTASSATVSVQSDAWYSDYYTAYQTKEGELPALAIEARPLERGQTPKPGHVDVGKPVMQRGPAGQSGVMTVHLPGSSGKGVVHVASLSDITWPSELRRVDKSLAVFDGLPPGKYMVSSSGEGGRQPKAVELAAGQKLDVTLEPGPGQIRGVIRSGGKPVGGEYISWFISPRIPQAVVQGYAQVQPDGSYAIEGLAEGTYRLIHEAPNSMPGEFTVQVKKGLNTFNINLPTSRIEGTLVGPTPKPKAPGEPSLGSIRVMPRGVSPMLSSSTSVFVEAEPDGRFTVEHLLPGRYTITGYGFVAAVTVEREDSVVSASLRAPEKPGEIAGAIGGRIPASLREDRHAIQVTAFPKDERGYDFATWTYSTQINPKTGAYRIRNLPAGTYGIYVVSLGTPPRIPCVWIPSIEVREGLSRELPIEIPEGRPVCITTEDRLSLNPTPTCTGWRLRMPTGDWVDGTVLGGGWRSEVVLPLGEYTIEASYGDRGTVTQTFTVERGEGTQNIAVNGPK